jgi:hypothetical protein
VLDIASDSMFRMAISSIEQTSTKDFDLNPTDDQFSDSVCDVVILSWKVLYLNNLNYTCRLRYEPRKFAAGLLMGNHNLTRTYVLL